MEKALVSSQMQDKGWVVLPAVLDQLFIDRLQADMEHAYETCRSIQVKNGITANTDGTVHHLLGQGASFLELLEKIPVWEHVGAYFGGNFILNSIGGVINRPGGSTYTRNVHRDVRTYSEKLPLMLNMLVMIDAFTEANGATYLYSGSHRKEEKPSDKEFFSKAERAIGPAGSILLFNSNVWHAGGYNTTDRARSALTLTFTKPFIKQQCDYPRLLGYDKAEGFSEQLRQIIGYNARVPANLEEWYQPPEKRMYKPGQG